MSRHKKLMTVCCAAVLTLGLAACGGGGGGDDRAQTSPPDMPSMPTPEPDPHVCDDGASQACVDARQAELDALGDDATVAELRAAEKALEDAQDALRAHNTATMENTTVSGLIDDAMTAIADIDEDSTPNEVAAGRAAIKAAQDSLDGMENLSEAQRMALQGRIDALNDAYNPIEMAANMAAATAAAGTKKTAISNEAAQAIGGTAGTDGTGGADAGLGGSARTDADGTTTADDASDDVYGLSISRDRDGTEIEITDPANAGDDDPKFAQAMGDNSFSMQTRTMEADDDGNVMTEVVVVHTDIEAPKATEFAKVMGQALNADLDTAVDADNDGTADDDLTGLWVGADATTAPVEATLGLVKSDAFGAGAGDMVVHTFARYQLDSDTGTDGNQTIQAFTTPGTYNGAMGTYRCGNVQTAADCTVTVDDEGMITAMSAGWIFIPDAGATSDVADADYLHYGFWLKRTADEDGAIEYNEVETFAGSSVAATGDLAGAYTVRGSANYEGGAAGVYVHSVTNPDGTEASATSGRFTAVASLTAYFGQTVDNPATTNVNEADQIAPALLNSISGTINDFNLSGHDTGPGWSVSLEQGTITSSTGIFSGVAKGGGADGTYNGTFHGPVGDHDSDADTPDIPHPTSVVGEFNANFSNGSVAGAFGARKQ